MKSRNLFYFIFILALIMYFFNPSKEKHRIKLGLPAEPILKTDETIPGLKYNNYFVFSTTKDTTDKTLTIGVLGFVFKK